MNARLPRANSGSSAVSHWILLVEDDRDLREGLQASLEGEGFPVVSVADGREALEVLRATGGCDLIVLDLRMPVMDGWEFRTLQKRDPHLADIPVVAISADGSAKAAAIDAQAYLKKPLRIGALLDAINRVNADVQRKRFSERLEQAERFAALGRLATTVGHEINNPLTFLLMNIDFVTQDIGRFSKRSGEGILPASRQELDEVSELVAECREGLDRIRNVVRNLQVFSRPPEGKHGPLCINDVLDRAIAMAKYKAATRATIVRRFSDLPTAIGDASALAQLFLNLVLNAAEVLPEGRATDNEICVLSQAVSGEVVVEISDTGPGIPPQVLPRLFDSSLAAQSLSEGSGLGLSVARRIVADHGGRIEAFNNPLRGATFRVALPLAGSDSG